MMMTAHTPVTHVTVQAPSCWTSFTSAASSAMIALANGVSRVWAGLKSGFNAAYATLTPYVARATVWMRANPQSAAVGALITGVATAAACYFYCRKPTAPVAPAAAAVVAVPVVPVVPGTAAATVTGTTTTAAVV